MATVTRFVPATFDQLVEHYDHYITQIIRRVSHGTLRAEDAEELKQEVYVRLLRINALEAYRPERAAFTTYLFRVIQSIVSNHFTSRHRNPLQSAQGLRPRTSPRPLGREYVDEQSVCRDTRQVERLEWAEVIERCRSYAESATDSAALLATLAACEDGNQTPWQIVLATGQSVATATQALATLRDVCLQLSA